MFLCLQNWCVLCRYNKADVNHLFLQFSFAHGLWNKVFNELRQAASNGQYQSQLSDILVDSPGSAINKRGKKLWKILVVLSFYGPFGLTGTEVIFRTPLNNYMIFGIQSRKGLLIRCLDIGYSKTSGSV